MPRCYELAHVVGRSKTRYVPATPRCLDWRHDLQQPAAARPGRPDDHAHPTPMSPTPTTSASTSAVAKWKAPSAVFSPDHREDPVGHLRRMGVREQLRERAMTMM